MMPLFTFQSINNCIFLLSYVGNRGTFKSSELRRVIRDRALLSQLAFFAVAVLGAFVHEFFYSLLVCYNIVSRRLLNIGGIF